MARKIIGVTVGTSINPQTAIDKTIQAQQIEKNTQDIGDLVNQVDGLNIPTKVSQLENDSNYLTEVPSEYITETELNNKGYLTQHQDLTSYAKKSEIPTTASQVGADVAGSASNALAEAKSYTDTSIANIEMPDVGGKIGIHNTATDAHNDIRDLISGLSTRLNALADSDDTTLDQMSEIVAYIKSNKSLIDSITTSKVNVSDIIDNLTTNTSNKPLSASQGVALKNLIDSLSTTIDGISIPTKVSDLDNDKGYLTDFTETDPTVPSWAKAATKPTYTASEVGADVAGAASAVQTNLSTHTNNSDIHVTTSDKSNWNSAYNHSTSAHAPSNAEKNQNAFSNVTVGSTTIAADSTTDTLTLVAGSNITLTPDASNDKITIAATDTVYTHPNSGVTAGTYRSVTVNEAGHVTAGTNPTTLSGYGITDAASKTHEHAISDVTNLQSTLDAKVPTSRTVNGKALSSDITLSASDLNAMSTTNPTGTGSFSLNRRANTAIGENSIAEGWDTAATGVASHAEGFMTDASGTYSHAENYYATASGWYTHAEGGYTTASGNYSHAEGLQTISAGVVQHVQGKFNIEDTTNKYAHIVGNGANNARSNAHTLDWNGNAWYQGKVLIGGTSQDDASELTTKDYVDSSVSIDYSDIEFDTGDIENLENPVIYQTKEDGNLLTENQTIVGAINELYTDIETALNAILGV